MPWLIKDGKREFFPDEYVESFTKKGWKLEDRDAQVRTVDPVTGDVVSVPGSQIGAVGVGRGATLDEASEENQKRITEETFGTPGQQVLTGIEGFGSGLSFGLTDAIARSLGNEQTVAASRARSEANPGTRALSEIGGAIAPALLTGGGSLAATAARTPAGLVLNMGSRIARTAEEAGTVARLVRGAAAGALEGTAFGAGAGLSRAMLSEDPVSAEMVASAMMDGALEGAKFGAAFGAAIPAAGRAIEAVSNTAGRTVRKLRDIGGMGADEASIGAARSALKGTLDRTIETGRTAMNAADEILASSDDAALRGLRESVERSQADALRRLKVDPAQQTLPGVPRVSDGAIDGLKKIDDLRAMADHHRQVTRLVEGVNAAGRAIEPPPTLGKAMDDIMPGFFERHAGKLAMAAGVAELFPQIPDITDFIGAEGGIAALVMLGAGGRIPAVGKLRMVTAGAGERAVGAVKGAADRAARVMRRTESLGQGAARATAAKASANVVSAFDSKDDPLVAGGEDPADRIRRTVARASEMSKPDVVMESFDPTLLAALGDSARAIADTVVRRARFLLQEAPTDDRPASIATKWRPRRRDVRRFENAVIASRDPIWALDRVSSGGTDPVVTRALDAVYPQLMSRIRSTLIEESQREDLTGPDRRRIARLMDAFVDPTDDPVNAWIIHNVSSITRRPVATSSQPMPASTMASEGVVGGASPSLRSVIK